MQSRVNRVYASPFLERVEETLADDASDSNSSFAESDYYSDFGWDDHSDAHSFGSYTSEEGEDNLDHPLEDVDFFTFVPIPTASLSRSPLVDEEESTTSVVAIRIRVCARGVQARSSSYLLFRTAISLL